MTLTLHTLDPKVDSGGQAAGPVEHSTDKPRIAVFSLTGCEGCSLAILEAEDQLLGILDAVDIVNFREVMSERHWNIDIGFVDGAVSTPYDEKEVRCLRELCRILVAMGACACLGGVNTLKHYQDEDQYRTRVYGNQAFQFPTTEARPIHAVVNVDYSLPGCPVTAGEFLRFIKCMLTGRPFKLPTYPVCVECKRRGTLCQYEKGSICLGPITRAGCGAICPHFSSRCEGCRGVISEDLLKTFRRNVCEQRGVPVDDVLASLRLYGAHQGKELP